MTPSLILSGWWAKVKRGQEHREALDLYISDTLAVEANFPTLAVKFDVETLQHVLYVKRTPDLSEFYSRVGIIFGDCINNLRNSLDYLVYEMGVRHSGGLKHPGRIKFPIVSRTEDWAGICGKELGEVSPKQRALIESFQPYHKRDMEQDGPQGQAAFHPLEMLRELTDLDKHRLLTAVAVPTGSALAMSPIAEAMMRSGQCQIMHADCGGLPLELGAEIWRAKMPDDSPKDEVENAGRIESLIVLTQDHKRPVIPLINTLTAMVTNIIHKLESTLSRSTLRI